MTMAFQTQAKAPTKTSSTPVHGGLLQRKCACGGPSVGEAECDDCASERRSLQRSAAGRAEPATVPRSVHDVLRSAGQPLDTETRAFMEPRLGHDFSQVRVHSDARAAESARAVNALAYTVGQDVVFGGGEYAPNTRRGQRLLAHELTHVVQQQGRGRLAPKSLGLSTPFDPAEREADAVAESIVERRQTPTITLAATGLQRDVGWAQRGDDPYGTAESPWIPACPVKSTGTLSEVSWGETAGLYPTEENKFQPEKWNQAKTCELLEVRGALHAVAQRGESVRKGTPKESDALEQKLKVYHLIENFPALDSAISDTEVKWFFLSPDSDKPAVHPATTGTMRVKTYGSFYNIGGGDVKKGDVYIHFYKLKPETP